MIQKHEPFTAGIPQNQLVFAAENFQDPSLGAPPAIVARPGDMSYVGFFETELGEQLFVTIDRDETVGVLRSGDIGWQNQIMIEDNMVQGDHVMSLEEYSWLAVCWLAATSQVLVKPVTLTAMDVVKDLQNEG